MRNAIARCALGLGVAGLLVMAASEARAQQTLCGSIPGGQSGWNVPNGGTVFVSGPGPIYSVLASVGEYRSHSMMSNGPGGWITHATSTTPPTKSPGFCTDFCSSPIDGNFLSHSMPGLEQVTAAGIYTFLFNGGGANTGNSSADVANNSGGAGTGESFMAYQDGTPSTNQDGTANTTNYGALAANFAWSGGGSIGFSWDGSTSDSTQGFYNVTYNGSPTYYGWYEYMNSAGQFGYPNQYSGVVCSSSLSMWQVQAAQGYKGKNSSVDVYQKAYPPSVIGPAASALYNSVKSECEQTNGFFASFASAIQQVAVAGLCGTCGAACAGCWLGIGCGNLNSYDGDPCDEAADQMVNTFASMQDNYGDDCNYDNENHWHGVVNNSTAYGVSPDVIAGWTNMPYTGPGSSVWAYDSNHLVQWNSGGSTYACWD